MSNHYQLVVLLLLATACTPKTEPSERAAAKSEAVEPAAEPEPAKLAPEPKQAEPEPEPPASAGDVYHLVPARSIGPVRMDMTKAEIEALGFETHPDFSAMTIPISVNYDLSDRPSSIEISLLHTDKPVWIRGVTIPKHASSEQVRELLGDCVDSPGNIATGGTLTPCVGGKVSIAVGSGSPNEVWLRTGGQ